MPCDPIPNPANNASNPFANVLNATVRQQFCNAIDSLVSDDGCTVTCRLFYGSARCVPCTNCVTNHVTGSAAGVYQAGGPAPFGKGQLCPLCQNAGEVFLETSEDFKMMVSWDTERFIKLSRNNVEAPRITDSFAETFCRIEWWLKIVNADYAILNVCDECLDQRWKRITVPEPCGLGQPKYIRTLWQLD